MGHKTKTMRAIMLRNEFVITHDHLEGKSLDDSQVLKVKSEGYNIHFKLFDDDRVHYYSGYLHEVSEDEFSPLDWAMYDSGCTIIQYRNTKTNKYEDL
jgi:hypothetical protein